MERQLKNRIRYFFSWRYRGREDVRRTFEDLRKYGQLALMGGMLRDLTLFGNRGFKSDLDFVIVPDDIRAFDKHLMAIGAKINKFGGYALPSNKWQVDVWPLERTWAHVAGHTKVRTFGDLRNATFFKCDAILYDFDHRKLKTTSDYFQDIENRVLEINLLPNPNPRGNAVRAVRYALMKGFRWGPKLSKFVDEMIACESWEALQDEEMRSYGTQYLGIISSRDMSHALRRHVAVGGASLFNPADFRKNIQLLLPCIHEGQC